MPHHCRRRRRAERHERAGGAGAGTHGGAPVTRSIHKAEDAMRRLREIAARVDGSVSPAAAPPPPGAGAVPSSAARSDLAAARQELASLAADVDQRMALARQAADRFADA